MPAIALRDLQGSPWRRRETWVQAFLRYETPESSRRIIYLLAWRGGPPDYECYTSIDNMALQTATSHNTVRAGLRWLCDNGWLIWLNPDNRGGRNRSNIYALSLPGYVT
jgi:hypothetical protein